MHLFYTPLLNPGMEAFLLDEAESKHAVRVLRLGVGDRVQLVDGRGGFYDAEIGDANPKRVVLRILSVQEQYRQRNHRLHIAIAPTKNMERLEWFLEKATEIGIDEITPLICDRSERREVKIERLEKVVVAAMKQSQKAYLPRINEAVRFSAFIKGMPVGAVNVAGAANAAIAVPSQSETAQLTAQASTVKRFIAHCDAGEKAFLSASVEPGDSVVILIGPEGDFSPGEISEALDTGFTAISLGESRLRTETAALAACMEVELVNRG